VGTKALNPAIAAGMKGKHYKAVFIAPGLGILKQARNQTETPQMKYLPYRGSVRPGIDASYGKVSSVVDDTGDFKT